eukprot:GEMP01112878.1.p1 GENE.GEMP01112878.1~~GEMP01112878.1.p1  ORF type:complete len:100 (+),score=13.90 GEMP01112878.1:181-480(+)
MVCCGTRNGRCPVRGVLFAVYDAWFGLWRGIVCSVRCVASGAQLVINGARLAVCGLLVGVRFALRGMLFGVGCIACGLRHLVSALFSIRFFQRAGWWIP